MRYPLGLVLDSAKHLAARKLRGEKKISLTLSFDLLGGHARASANGNGPVSTGPLTVEQCLAAMEECGAPIISTTGSEPLEYPEIARLTKEILGRRRHFFLRTDGSRIRRHLHMIPPDERFFWKVRLDGTEAVHDARTGRPGLFREAMDGIRLAKNAGFFVVVTTTIYEDTEIADVAALYERLHAFHVDGYMLVPHYPAGKLCKNGCAAYHEKMRARFRESRTQLAPYNVLTLPSYLELLRGERDLDCGAWSSPLYSPQGWASPCAFQSAKYESTYRGLIQNTLWENYGRGMHPRCEPCLSPAGFEAAAIVGWCPSASDIWKVLRWQFQGNLGEKRERPAEQ